MIEAAPRCVARDKELTLVNGDRNLAVFCDFENIAIGARDAKYARFDIQPVLQKLLLKGSIVVKKAYCDWERYKEFKPAMHEAAFELIEIPHLRQSGKNSADIRMVVDALDLCYTKAHLDTFVIISGDSDFSPLVSKLRENAKTVIGVGVKSSTSDLLMSNCDEFILYDDLVRRAPARQGRRRAGVAQPPPAAKVDEAKTGEPTTGERAPPKDKASHKDKSAPEDRTREAIDLVLQTLDALVAERGDSAKLWGSMIKQTLKRRQPMFNESYFGFSSFNELLEEAQARKQLALEMDEKSGGYVVRRMAPEGQPAAPVAAVTSPRPRRRSVSSPHPRTRDRDDDDIPF
jgi:uncharacterized protein (TIGR00288 family)